MKRVKLAGLVLCFGLTGCVVADMDSSNYAYFPYVQMFQKVDTPGHTNVQQRRNDLYACGVDRSHSLNSWDTSFVRNERMPNETLKQMVTRIDEFESCMVNKGYIVHGFAECGPRKKPSGLCN